MTDIPTVDRTLYVFRHGEAAPGSADLDDEFRPLTEKGRRDVLRFGAILRRTPPTVVWCSPATRTRETLAGLVASAAPTALPTTHEPRIYDASLDALLEVLAETPRDATVAALVGHNPGVSDLVRTLLAPETKGLGPITPGTLVVLRTRAAWDALGRKSCTLALYDSP